MYRNADHTDSRILRASATIRRVINDYFTKGKIMNPKFDAIVVMVSDVILSVDKRYADVYLNYHTELDITHEQFIADIEEINKDVRLFVARNMKVRYVPELRFKFDYNFDKIDRIDKILSNIS